VRKNLLRVILFVSPMALFLMKAAEMSSANRVKREEQIFEQVKGLTSLEVS
jgi:hypothetical protein